VDVTEFHWIDGSCCFLSLFSCQGSVNEAGGILLATLLPVKTKADENADVSFQHRLVRLQNQSACVSDGDVTSVVNDLPWGTRSV
jgi:hypothetical protein